MDPGSTSIGLLILVLFVVIVLRPNAKVNATRIGLPRGPFSTNVLAAKREFGMHGHLLVERGYREVNSLRLAEILEH